MKKPPFPTREEVLSRATYDPESCSFTLPDGRDATCSGGGGYRALTVHGWSFLAHRLAWMLIHGSEPDRCIDHINGNPGDNRIANLRLATQAENNRNKRASRTSKSGIKGVTYQPSRRKWYACIAIDGKNRNLGRHDTAEAAADAYRQAAIHHFGEFARADK